MIAFDLECSNGHVFEGWFNNTASFEEQRDKKMISCPFCDDKKPSAGIYQSNGDYRYKCHKCGFGGSVLDVIAKVDGIEVAEVFNRLSGDSRSQRQPPKIYPNIEALKQAVPGEVSEVYQYTNPNSGRRRKRRRCTRYKSGRG